ncbi:DNA-directed RNA polymerase subunit beta [Paramicrosporidium saccamoebae]|uniref:DNA-directed RNA polymerase subunit beta n=1 Tax=Paramicrosporidium saccamoebae TaxID=1246581 RepID=A0A2H9TL82_9FUNG|nr:DNA-directed RNA polymerase subunit beta [Paramicrosporidium saccamoebae]
MAEDRKLPSSQSLPSSFETLKFYNSARHPSSAESDTPRVHELIRPHIDSFNAIFDDGLLDRSVANLEVRESEDGRGNRLRFWLEDVQVGKPLLSEREVCSLNRFLYPNECRERGVTYKGKMGAKLMWSINDGPVKSEVRAIGSMPIMIRSNRCHLEDLSPKQLVARREDAEELGGCFVVNGIERLMRLLIAARRNHPMVLFRPSLAKRGPMYSQYGLQIRCVRNDESSQTIYLHYLNNGACMMRVHIRKAEYLIPLMLVMKALVDTNDKEIMESVLHGDVENTFISGRVEGMLREFKKEQLFSRKQCLEYLGERMVTVLNMSSDATKEEIGKEFLRRYVLVHLEDNLDKFNLFTAMVRKLYAVVGDQCCADNPDSPMNHEILLTGQVYCNYLKEKLDDWLTSIKLTIATDLRRTPASVDFGGDASYVKKIFAKVPADIGKKLEYFLATGNLVSNTGMDLQQTSGYTVVAEKLNFMRYLAHFRAVHRGAFFAELKTTTVRKLQPEAWGFMCPVHTPDGAPCGLLNHMSHSCKVVTTGASKDDVEATVPILISLGCLPVGRHGRRPADTYPVMVDGRWCLNIRPDTIISVAKQLRNFKAQGMIHEMIEIAAIPPSNGGLYPGLYLFTGASRMMRPVQILAVPEKSIHIGTLEQVYLDIAVKPEEVIKGVTELVELQTTNFLSVVANLTPFPDHNQSPRNMYQCQMGKQSMATPLHNYPHRTDNKLYRLLNPQSPIVRTMHHSRYCMDHYPTGANAVVAVISYTGYDMEDAMILNKSSYERGFGHGIVYKSEFYDISDRNVRGEPKSHFFGVKDAKFVPKTLEIDGLPAVGQKVSPDDVLFSVNDEATGQTRVERYKGFEDAYIEEVRLLGDDNGEGPLQKVNIKFRIPRNPIIGDKFSSRHGQKGICSQKYPTVDMPFTETGMTPDVIINPHAFPSRMTIGMFVESMAAKAGSLHGIAQDATPFTFSEKDTAAEYFGEQLKSAGYNYYGNEPMYSGITGVEMKADIYIGVVYYQRLRHMVSDKFQVRTTGPVHNLTQQPVKGRKRAGGIRFGEMERDSLLAHGVSFLLQDRLMNCSDYSQAYVCRRCGSILSPIAQGGRLDMGVPKVHCHTCNKGDALDVIAIPFVFRYLAAELMAMNIDIKLHVN